MFYRRFNEALSDAELEFMTDVFENFLANRYTAVSEREKQLVESIQEKAERLIPLCRFQKVVFTVVRLTQREAKTIPFVMNALDLQLRLYVCADIKDFLRNVPSEL